MFYLPVFINQSRFHYCKLQAAGADPDPVELSFVLQKGAGHAAELLRIYKNTLFLSAHGYGSDVKFSVRDTDMASRLSPGAVQELEVRFSRSEAPGAGLRSTGLEGTDFAWEEDAGDVYLRYQGLGAGTIRLRLVLEGEDKKEFQGSFLLHVAPPRQIFDAVFDFGSEASQIAVHQRGTEPSHEPRVNLVDRMIFDFYAPALREGRLSRKPDGQDGPRITLSNVDRKRFMAFDHHQDGTIHKEFFNSSFFVLRSYRCGEEHGPENPQSAPYAEGDHEWVSLLGDTYDQRYMIPAEDRDYEIVPNLKLAELGISRNFSLCVNGRHIDFSKDRVQSAVFRRVLCQFLHLLLREIELDNEKDRGKLLKITVLVPNIYSQLRVATLIRHLYEDLRRIIAEQDYGFAGVEVQTLSESDAALLGLITDPGVDGLDHTMLRNGDHCLVFDSGKGTTDISILSVGPDQQYSSTFRSGFAGAGNALTYAFADTLFAAVAGPENTAAREQFLRRFLDDQQDLGARYLFHRELETVKKNYGKRQEADYTYDLEQFKAIFAGLRPQEDRILLWQKLQDQFSKPGKTFRDYYGIIDATIEMLVQKAVERVREAGPRKFAVVILSGRSFLMDDYRQRLEAALRANFGVGKVVFRPNNLKRSCLLGPLNHPQGTNRNSDLIGTPVFGSGSGFMGDLLKMLRGKKAGGRKKLDPTNIHLRDFYLEGVEFEPWRENVSICGKQPILNGLPTDEVVNLAYVGENFLLRTRDAGIEANFVHSTGPTLRTDPLAWMSLFPHVSGPGYITPARVPEPVSPAAPPVNRENPAQEAQPSAHPPSPDDDMWDYI